MSKKQSHPLIFGTIILTATGFLSRIIGFFYRIYLSRLFGEEGMGIYQLLSPVLSLSFSLTSAGYQTAISKLVAEQAAREKRPSFRPLIAGLSISLPLSLLCNLAVYRFADVIAASLLQEPRTADMLRILSFSIPFGAVHACANGYFYGIKKAGIPSASQLLEQLTRVGCVYIISARSLSLGQTPSVDLAVLGLTVGEFFSMVISMGAAWQRYAKDHSSRRMSLAQSVDSHNKSSGTIHSRYYSIFRDKSSGRFPDILHGRSSGMIHDRSSSTVCGKFSGILHGGSSAILYSKLLAMALPLTANRIVLNLLQSVESVSIPARLRLYGYDNVTALSVYGVLTGMAMPFIFFPNALTSSVAILLLPMISESFTLGDMNTVKHTSVRTVKYCGLMGFGCMCVFVLFGHWAGENLFHSPLAGYFITTLGFICPFLYLDTTLSSILQGLGLAGHIFALNVVCLLIRLGFVFLAVPKFGISGYLWGLLVSQLTLGMLYLVCLYRFLKKNEKKNVMV